MAIKILEISQHDLQDAGKCNGVFTVDSTLILSVQNDVIHYTISSVPAYQKRYPVESIDYGAYINQPDRVVFLAYSGHAIAGEIRLRRNWNQYAYVEDIVVDENFRRCGIGRLLLQRAIEWAKDKGLPGIMLETQDNNVAACMLYQACGFEIGGFDRRLYQGLDPNSEEVALYWYLTFIP
jgi:streptothricin acetyltransferase